MKLVLGKAMVLTTARRRCRHRSSGRHHSPVDQRSLRGSRR
jgi:hypothetical protein